MNKLFAVLIVIFGFFIIGICDSNAQGYGGKLDMTTPAQSVETSSPILMTSADLKKDYDILGLITAVTGSTDIDSLRAPMASKAESLGADYIIGVEFVSHAGALYGYGTAVKTKKSLPK